VDLRSAGLSNSASAGQRLRKKRQALVHPVIDAGMVVGELLVAMPDPKLIQPSYEPAGAVEQVELVLFAAIDVEGFQLAKIVRLAFDRSDGTWRPCSGCFLSSRRCSPTADIKDRSIAWLNRCRRLAKDWENLNRKALAFLRLASIRLLLRKLCNPT
jgi:hypothetical protein